MTAIERVEAALRAAGCKQPGGRGNWTCPAHDDKQASLSVTGAQGRVLVHCHAGCGTDAVLEAARLQFRDLYTDEPRNEYVPAPSPSPAAVYEYRDTDGQVVYEVVRKAGKKFAQRRRLQDGTFSWGLGDTVPTLYKLPELIEAVQAGETVYVCEGEKDVEAVIAAGGAATCNSGGAGKWPEGHGHHFAGADVVIVADRDDAGMRHAQRVAKELEPHAASVRFAAAAQGKDAADHLGAGLGLDALLPLTIEADKEDSGTDLPNVTTKEQIVARALLYSNVYDYPVDDPYVIELVRRDFKLPTGMILDMIRPQEDWTAKALTIQDIASTTVTTPRWLIEDVLRAGTLNAFSGDAKAGKSRLALAAIESVLTGRPFLDQHEVITTGPVVLFSSDDDDSELTRVTQEWITRRKIPLDAPLTQFHNVGGFLDSPRDVDRFIALLNGQPNKPVLVVFDSAYNFQRSDDIDRAIIKEIYGINLKKIQAEVGCAVLVLEHSAKTGGEGANSIIGSQAKGAAVRSGITVKVEDQDHVRDSDGANIPLVKLSRWGNTGRSWRGKYEHDGAEFTWTRVEDDDRGARLVTVMRDLKAKFDAGSGPVLLSDYEDDRKKRMALGDSLTKLGFTLDKGGPRGAARITGLPEPSAIESLLDTPDIT